MKQKKTRAILTVIIALSLGALASCGGSDSVADTTIAAGATPVISVTRQWARTSPMETTMGAAYLTITTDKDDTLTGAMVDPSIAAMTQVHETVMGDNGEMKMQEVDGIEIVAGTPTELKPGGFHIMLMDVKTPLKTGDTLEITLKFAKAGEIVVEVPIQEDAP
jgi:copper(I)-binding protein